MSDSRETAIKWFVMRDLRRSNAREHAYEILGSMGVEVFTPMKRALVVRCGRRTRVEVPFLSDLLFVHDCKQHLDSIVEKMESLQYRFVKGGYREPMVVPEAHMNRFINAVRSSDNPKYYLPDEITPQMYGRKIRVIGGPMDTYEGYLLTRRGSKDKRLLLEMESLLGVSVEVSPEYIELV